MVSLNIKDCYMPIHTSVTLMLCEFEQVNWTKPFSDSCFSARVYLFVDILATAIFRRSQYQEILAQNFAMF